MGKDKQIHNLTSDEIEQLKQAAGTGQKWADTVDQILRERGGSYPPDWYQKVIIGGIIDGTITIHSGSRQESFGTK